MAGVYANTGVQQAINTLAQHASAEDIARVQAANAAALRASQATIAARGTAEYAAAVAREAAVVANTARIQLMAIESTLASVGQRAAARQINQNVGRDIPGAVGQANTLLRGR